MFGVLNAKNLAFSTPDALMDYMCFYRSPLFPLFFSRQNYHFGSNQFRLSYFQLAVIWSLLPTH